MTETELIQSYHLPNGTVPAIFGLTQREGHVPTFQELIEGYLAHLKPKPSWVVYRQLCHQHFEGWTEHPTFLQLEDWHAQHRATPHAANKGIAFLRAMYTRAILRGLYPGPNPARGVRAYTSFSRERVMTSTEIGMLLRALELTPDKFAAAATISLTTGARASEVLRMRWTDIDLQTGLWNQPTTKNGKPHTTYLPTQARAAMLKLPRRNDYVLTGRHDAAWSLNGYEKGWWKVREDLGLDDVRLHDFRRTLATHLYMETHDEYLVKRCINHHNRNVTAIYVRISHAEVAKALQAQADRFYAFVPPRHDSASPVNEDPKGGELPRLDECEPQKVTVREHGAPPTPIPLSLESEPDTFEEFQGLADRPATRAALVQEGREALSRRELDVFALFSQGQSVKTIAQSLMLSVKTVSTYRDRLLDKLQLKSTTDLIRFALLDGRGFLDLPAMPAYSHGPGFDRIARSRRNGERAEWPG